MAYSEERAPDTSVLVADPDADTRRLYTTLFVAEGWRCLEASDGRDALVQALTLAPSLCVSELRLPMIDGLSLCKELRKDPQTEHLPILFVTAEARAEQLARARRVGASAVLVKPTPPETIVRTAADLIAEHNSARLQTAAARQALADERRRAAALSQTARDLVRQSRKDGHRYRTAEPTEPPPPLLCPECLKPLNYELTYYGGVNARLAERWDALICASGCGARFEYRFRTRSLRRVGIQAR